MVNKILFCATVDYHFQKFHVPYLKWFKDKGWEVHVAAFGRMTLPFVDCKYQLPIQREPLGKGNIQAYKKLKMLVNEHQYDIIHCHTPMGGALARLAARKSRSHGTKVIYTAHGFHFCKGAPWLNWLIYYPAEKILSHYTDCLITINHEDYLRVKKRRWCKGKVAHVHGVGVDTQRFHPADESLKLGLRKGMGYNENTFIMFYAAEFNRNKNQAFLIRALSLIKEQIPNSKLLLAGDGPLLNTCKDLAIQQSVENSVDFIGYQNNVGPYLKISDLSVASSIREGLPVNILEAMASGLPILATENRGHNELVQNGENGYLVSPNDINLFSKRLYQLYQSKELRKKMQSESLHRVRHYSLEAVQPELNSIYQKMMPVTRLPKRVPV